MVTVATIRDVTAGLIDTISKAESVGSRARSGDARARATQTGARNLRTLGIWTHKALPQSGKWVRIFRVAPVRGGG